MPVEALQKEWHVIIYHVNFRQWQPRRGRGPPSPPISAEKIFRFVTTRSIVKMGGGGWQCLSPGTRVRAWT